GMTDLWDPTRRAALCASCHIGNLEEGKCVTHEMYAAGHPPLPGFEAATFCDAMPRHWQLPREKPARGRTLLGLDAGDYEQTRLVLVGAAVSLRESMHLLARQSAACLRSDDPDGKVLDYANFDCACCHHDLKAPRWRQRRGFPGVPGQVLPPSWPVALAAPAIERAYGKDAARQAEVFQRHWEQVEAGLLARPGGDPAQVGPAAENLA